MTDRTLDFMERFDAERTVLAAALQGDLEILTGLLIEPDLGSLFLDPDHLAIADAVVELWKRRATAAGHDIEAALREARRAADRLASVTTAHVFVLDVANEETLSPAAYEALAKRLEVLLPEKDTP